jgi:Mg-chelatase subunit ChlD
LALRASTPEGEPLMRLRPADLEASIEGQPAKVIDLVGPGGPLILVVVLDLVGDLNRIDAARTKIAEYVTAMGKNRYVALLRAQDGLQVILDPTHNRRQFVEKLESAPVSGFPGLLDTVEQTAEIASTMLQRSKIRVATLYLTDGEIQDYRGDYASSVVNPSDSGDLSRRFRDRLVQEKIASISANLGHFAAPLFFVHLEEQSDSLNVAYQNGIRQFAGASGGQAYFCRGLADVPTLIERALADIDSTYAVTLEAPGNWRGPRHIAISGPEGTRLTHRDSLEYVQPKK